MVWARSKLEVNEVWMKYKYDLNQILGISLGI